VISWALKRWRYSHSTKLVFATACALVLNLFLSRVSFAQSAGTVGSNASLGNSAVPVMSLPELQKNPTVTQPTCIQIKGTPIAEFATGLSIELFVELQALRAVGVTETSSSKDGIKQLKIGAEFFSVTSDGFLFKKNINSGTYESYLFQLTPVAFKQLLTPVAAGEPLMTYQQAKNDGESDVVCIAGGKELAKLTLLTFSAPAGSDNELSLASVSEANSIRIEITIPPLEDSQSSTSSSLSTHSAATSTSISSPTASDSSPASNSSTSRTGLKSLRKD
jgi:hypothetical protein